MTPPENALFNIYTIVITDGATQYSSILVTDTVPANTTCCASTRQGGTYTPTTNMVVWEFGSQSSGLADDWALPGQVSSRQTLPTLPLTLTFAVTVDGSAAAGTIITNTDYRATLMGTMGLGLAVGSPVTTTVESFVNLPLIRK